MQSWHNENKLKSKVVTLLVSLQSVMFSQSVVDTMTAKHVYVLF